MRNLNPRHFGWLTALCAIGLIGTAPAASFAQLFHRWYEPCVPCPTAPSTGAAQPGAGEAGATAPSGSGAAAGAAAETAAPSNLLAYSGAGAASGPESAAPNMVGDYLGGVFVSLTAFGPSGAVTTKLPLSGGGIPRFKMAEDTSPLPVDRVYFNYDNYSNVPINANTVGMNPDVNVNGYTPGFEKTFFDGVISVEVRLPMATTLSHNIFLDGTTGVSEGEIGNLGITVKALLLQSDTFAISGGLGIDCPTAHDQVCATDANGGSAIEILNQSVHLLPFVGGLWTPNDRLFCIGYMQIDIDANGDAVNNGTFANGTFVGSPSGGPGAGSRYYEQTMLYLDGVAGYWIARNDDRDHRLKGIALFGEVHVDQSLNTSTALPTVIGTMSGDSVSIVDMTAGADFQFGQLTNVTVAYCTPLTQQREFDGQFRLMINRRF